MPSLTPERAEVDQEAASELAAALDELRERAEADDEIDTYEEANEIVLAHDVPGTATW